MNYIVIDLEWNQSPEGKEKEEKALPFEIIEIGAVKLDESRNIVDEFREIVKPQVYQEIHSKTKEIIHIEMEELQEGTLFPMVAERFFKWCGEEYYFCTWGPVDLVEFQRNLKFYNKKGFSDVPFPYYDIQKLFGLIYEGEKNPRTLNYAVEFLSIEILDVFHRAIYDARYTAKVFQKMDMDIVRKNASIDYFNVAKCKKDEVHIHYDNYSKYISMEYDTKESAMMDRDVTQVSCFLCGKKALRKIGWFSNSTKKYFALYYCKEHGFLKGKIRIKKSIDEKFFVVKTIKLIDKESALGLQCKKRELYEKRRARKKQSEI